MILRGKIIIIIIIIGIYDAPYLSSVWEPYARTIAHQKHHSINGTIHTPYFCIVNGHSRVMICTWSSANWQQVSKLSALRRFDLIWKHWDKCAYQYNTIQYNTIQYRELASRSNEFHNQRFESRPEHKEHFWVFPSQNVVLTCCRCVPPLCICTHKTVRMLKTQ